MRKSSLLAIGIVTAAPSVAQVTPTTIVPAVDEAPSSTSVVETDAANKTALSATAAQTARIMRDRQDAAAGAAAYARTQAEYAAAVKTYEAEKAAVARKNAEGAEAYRQRLAAWQEMIDQRRQPIRKPAKVAAADGPSKVTCTFELRTGSNMPVRVCR